MPSSTHWIGSTFATLEIAVGDFLNCEAKENA